MPDVTPATDEQVAALERLANDPHYDWRFTPGWQATRELLARIRQEQATRREAEAERDRAIDRWGKETTAVVIDVQPTEFDIVIMADGVPQPGRLLELFVVDGALQLALELLQLGLGFGRLDQPHRGLAQRPKSKNSADRCQRISYPRHR